MKELNVGQRYTGTIEPRIEHLASSIGNPGVHVVSSPATIAFLETASHAVIDTLLEGSEGTVGVGFDLKHVGAAQYGRTLEISAEIVEIDLPRVVFEVEARQGDRRIMHGRHTRSVIDRERLLKGFASAEAPTLSFWFDVHSPWAHIAAHRIGDIARSHNATLRFRPLHLPSLIDAINGRRPLEENAAFGAWYAQDLKDSAKAAGVEVRYHPDYPLRNSRALRTCLYADEQHRAEDWLKALMTAYWVRQRDISELEVLKALADDCGLDPDGISEAATSADYSERLKANTTEAIERGIFGVPTVDTGERLYFGNDRLDLLHRHLVEHALGLDS